MIKKYIIKPKKVIKNISKNQIIICSITILYFVILTTFVVTGKLKELDEYLLQTIHENLPSWFIYIARASYFLGEAEVAIFFVLFTLGVLVWKKYWEEAQVMAFSCLFILILIDKIFKPLFAISRPLDRLVENAFGNSYPSGHAAGNLLLYFLICYFISQFYPKLKVFLYSLAVFLLILMGISSAYLRVHWVSDIIASYAVGYIMFVCSITILKSSK